MPYSACLLNFITARLARGDFMDTYIVDVRMRAREVLIRSGIGGAFTWKRRFAAPNRHPKSPPVKTQIGRVMNLSDVRAKRSKRSVNGTADGSGAYYAETATGATPIHGRRRWSPAVPPMRSLRWPSAGDFAQYRDSRTPCVRLLRRRRRVVSPARGSYRTVARRQLVRGSIATPKFRVTTKWPPREDVGIKCHRRHRGAF